MKNVQLWQSAPPLRLVTFSPFFRPTTTRHHDHPFYELALLLNGHCTWHVGPRHRISLTPGEALLLKPRTMHAEEVTSPKKAHVAWLGFDFAGPAPAWCQQAVALEEDAAEIAGYFEAIAREHTQTGAHAQARVRLALQSLLLLLERRALGAGDPTAARSDLNARQAHTVESAAHYFRNNLQHPLSVAQVAAYHSLCPGHFSTLFRRRHRVSPRGFLQRARLARAQELLAGTDAPLKEIAAQCGFVDAAHLCKAFRKGRRTTPGRFRAKSGRAV